MMIYLFYPFDKLVVRHFVFNVIAFFTTRYNIFEYISSIVYHTINSIIQVFAVLTSLVKYSMRRRSAVMTIGFEKYGQFIIRQFEFYFFTPSIIFVRQDQTIKSGLAIFFSGFRRIMTYFLPIAATTTSMPVFKFRHIYWVCDISTFTLTNTTSATTTAEFYYINNSEPIKFFPIASFIVPFFFLLFILK